jgi:hypothetical protein
VAVRRSNSVGVAGATPRPAWLESLQIVGFVLFWLPLVGTWRLIRRPFPDAATRAWRERERAAPPGTLRVASGRIALPDGQPLPWSEVRDMRWFVRRWAPAFAPAEDYVLVEVDLADGRTVRAWADTDLRPLTEAARAHGQLRSEPLEAGVETSGIAELLGGVLALGWAALVIYELRQIF